MGKRMPATLTHLLEWYPPVGVFIGILALLGVLVPLLRDLTKIGKWEKALWTIVMLALVGLEIRSIYLDRDAHDREQAAARAEQLKQFSEIAKGIDTSITNSQKQFDATMSGIKMNIDTVTGGNTFCYVMASPVFSEFGLNIITIGKSPLHDVSVWMIDIDTMKQVVAGKPSLSYEDIQGYTINFPTIPFLTASTTQMLTRIPTGIRTKRNLQITFSSLNGIWTETLKLEFVNGQWAQALKVGKLISPVKGGTPNEKLTTPLYTFATDNFPKRDGKVDWSN
jgi:hypothetical protein